MLKRRHEGHKRSGSEDEGDVDIGHTHMKF